MEDTCLAFGLYPCIPTKCRWYKCACCVLLPLETLPLPLAEIRVGEYLSSGLFCLQRKHLALWVFLNMGFHGEALLARHPTPKLEDHPLSAVPDCLFNLFAATLHIGGRSSIRNLRTRHAVVTGTHLTWKPESLRILKAPSTWMNALLNTSDHGLLHPFKGHGAVVNGLTGITLCWWSVFFSSFCLWFPVYACKCDHFHWDSWIYFMQCALWNLLTFLNKKIIFL
jgi:hypothetical protein